jgi:hypothetical protein
VYSKEANENIYDPEKWKLDVVQPNPLGEVPVVKFTNADERGEYEPYLDILDRINHMLLQRLVIATTQAFRQRVIAGDFPTHDADGNEIDYNGIFEAGAGSLWMVPEGASVEDLAQSDIQGILQAVRADIQDFAAVTRTPMHYLAPDSSSGSAEGASLAREGLVFKTEDRIARATPGWSKVMSLLFRWVGDEERAQLLDLEPIWKPAERYSLSERADANTKFQDIPFRTRMQLVGQFGPSEVAEMEVERAGEALLVAALEEATAPEPDTGPERGDGETVDSFQGLSTGDVVEFFAGVGQVEHIMVGGVLGIEGAEFSIIASPSNPALQVRLWEQVNGEWSATPVVYNVQFSEVTRLDGLP